MYANNNLNTTKNKLMYSFFVLLSISLREDIPYILQKNDQEQTENNMSFIRLKT